MANQYIGAMSALWNVGATTYYGIKMDVTDAASAAASKLIALQVGSVDMFSVSKAGAVVAAAGGTFAGALVATTLTLSGALSAVTSLTVTSADAGAAAGPAIVMDRNSATPAASDVIGVIYWNGRDSGGNAHTYADMFVTMTDVTNGSEDGTVTIRNSVAGSLTTQATITATGWNAMNIGATTRGTGAFTTLAANSTVTFTNGGSMTGTWSNLGTVTTVDINGGTITGITDLAVADGGTGASTAANARTNLGLGTIATQAASAVAITGGTIDGAVIGGASAAAISGTTGTFSSVHRALRYGIDRSPSFEIDAYKTGAANATINVANDTVQGIFQVSSTVQANFGTISNHPVSLRVNNLGVGEITSTGLNSTAIGATTRSTGAFTTLAANSTVTFTNGGSLTGTWSNLGTVTTVVINGGTITGITDLAVADGGTGASTAANARTNLGLGTIATQAASAVAITGGTIDGAVIGGSSAAAGTFTTLIGSAVFSSGGYFRSTVNDGITYIADNSGGGGAIWVYGSTHATLANSIRFFAGAGTRYLYDGVANTHTWFSPATFTTVDIGSITAVSDAILNVRELGNGIEFGHSNAAGYASTIGCETNSGASFIAFNAEAGTNSNTYRTRGISGTVLRGNLAGGLQIQNVATASADNQTATTIFTVASTGAVTLTGTLTASSGGSLTGTWSNLGTVTTMDLNGGNIDGTVIGGSSAAAGSFTTINSSANVIYNDGTIIYRIALQSASEMYTGTFTNHPVNQQINNTIVGKWTTTGLNAAAIGATTRSTGAFTTLAANSTVTFTNGGSMTGTWSNLGTVTTVDINGGTIDGAVIGGASAAAGSFTTLAASSTLNVTGVSTLTGGAQFGTFSGTGATNGKSVGAVTIASSVNSATAGTEHQSFYNPNGLVGSITTGGSATAYTTSSDYRLKTDVADFNDSGAMIDALRPVSYLWKADKKEGIGFIAHEVQEVFPDAISGEKDGERMQGGDWSKLVPVLVAELKSLRVRLAELEAA